MNINHASVLLIDAITKLSECDKKKIISRLKIRMIIHSFKKIINKICLNDQYDATNIYNYIGYLHTADLNGILPMIPKFTYRYYAYADADGSDICTGTLHAELEYYNKVSKSLSISFIPIVSPVNNDSEIRVNMVMEDKDNENIYKPGSNINTYNLNMRTIEHMEEKNIHTDTDIVSASAIKFLHGIIIAYNCNIIDGMKEKYLYGN